MSKISISDIRTLVAEGSLDRAIEDLANNFFQKEFRNYITTISGRYNTLNDKIITGVLTFEEQTSEENKIRVALLTIINKIELTEQHEQRLVNVNQKLSNHAVVEKLLEILGETKKGFAAQNEIRNQLYYNMRKRLSIEEYPEYEDFFSQYYPQMDSDELELHETLRYYTENILNNYNRKALELIIGNEELINAVPKLKALEKHLLVWLGKFEHLFHKYPSYGLIYTAVKERIPFPIGIKEELENYLNNEK